MHNPYVTMYNSIANILTDNITKEAKSLLLEELYKKSKNKLISKHLVLNNTFGSVSNPWLRLHHCLADYNNPDYLKNLEIEFSWFNNNKYVNNWLINAE